MIRFMFQSADHGETRDFVEPAEAFFFATDEANKWEQSLHGAGVVDLDQDITDHAYLAPLHTWRSTVRELDRLRRAAPTLGDFPVVGAGMAMAASPVGIALTWTIQFVGIEPAHFAAIAAGLVENIPINWRNPEALRGVLLFDRAKARHSDFSLRDQLTRPFDQVRQLTGSLEALQNTLSSFERDMQVAKAQAGDDTAEIKAALSLQRSDAEDARRVTNDRFDALVADGTAKMAAATEAIDQALLKTQGRVDAWIEARDVEHQLAAPAQLWADRADRHEIQAKKLLWIAVIVGVVAICVGASASLLAFIGAESLFERAIVPGKAPTGTLVAGSLRPTFHAEVIFTATVTLAWLTMYLWAMRVIVRLYTTEHHLAIDARSRGTMTETYLGLIEAQAASDVDRPIVLAALFRPVQDGIVKDDGPPGIGPAAALSGMLGGSAK